MTSVDFQVLRSCFSERNHMCNLRQQVNIKAWIYGPGFYHYHMNCTENLAIIPFPGWKDRGIRWLVKYTPNAITPRGCRWQLQFVSNKVCNKPRFTVIPNIRLCVLHNNAWIPVTHCVLCVYKADSRFALSQWETALLCNDVSHWLGASLESVLYYIAHGRDGPAGLGNVESDCAAPITKCID